MNRRRSRRVAWTVAVLLALLPWLVPASGTAAASPSLAVRLLGPFAGAAAGVQWTRVDRAVRAGRTDLALALAETAFALDPRSSQGRLLLARHLVFDRASPEREPDPLRRMAWFQAGLEIARRGEAAAANPAEVIEWQGIALQLRATSDPDLPWPGGVHGMWKDAAEHFERAAALGSRDSAELAARARQILDELEKP